MPPLPLDAYRQMVPDVWHGRPQAYSVDSLYRTLSEHEDGDFGTSGLLGRLLLRDDRIASCAKTRVNALLGCKQEVQGAEIDESTEEETIRDAARAWWPKVVTESVLRGLESDKHTYGNAFAEVVYGRSSRVWTPEAIVRWDVDHFRWSEEKDCWIVSTKNGEQEARHGDGRWIIYAPDGARSWRGGFLLSLADKWLMRQWTFRDWARFTEKLGQGVFNAKVPGNADKTAISNFLAQVQRIGANGAVVTPQGETPASSYGLELITTAGAGFQNFEAFTTALNVCIAVCIVGQNLTTEAQGGSYAAANVQDRVRGDLLEWDAETEATTLHTGLLMPWALANFGDADLAPWPARTTAPPEDAAANAATRKVVVETIAAASALSPRVDVGKELEEAGYELLDESEVPESPPAPALPPPTEEPAPLLNSQRVRLSQGEPSSFLHTGQKWVNGLVDDASTLGQDDVYKTILAIKKAAKQASGFEDFRMRLIDLASEAPSKASEDLFERAILLAVGQGTYSASLEIDAGP